MDRRVKEMDRRVKELTARRGETAACDCETGGRCRAAEALAAWENAVIERVKPEAGETVVVRLEGDEPVQAAVQLQQTLRRAFPNNELILLQGAQLYTRPCRN